MYIAPNTSIHILKNVPLDPTYQHTISWDKTGTGGKQAQYNYFYGRKKFSFTEQSYQRLQRGWMRIQKNAEALYDCNYLMYQNTAFGDKWFYAFITSVEYINNEVSEIHFEIDLMQTWYFDYGLDACFVEREHSEHDIVGENTMPEGLEIGDYETKTATITGEFSDWVIVVCTTCNVVGFPYSGSVYGRTYHQVKFKIYETTAEDIADLQTWLSGVGMLGNSNIIVNIFMCPRSFVYNEMEGIKMRYYTHNKMTANITGSANNPYGKKIKNNKLFCYPYNFLKVSNGQGSSVEIHYEYFSTPNCSFEMYIDASADPHVILAPTNYKGLSTSANFNDRITITDFPKCTFYTSDFLAKIVQGATSLALVAGTSGSALPVVTQTSVTQDVNGHKETVYNKESLKRGKYQLTHSTDKSGETTTTTTTTRETHDPNAEQRKNVDRAKAAGNALAQMTMAYRGSPCFGDSNTMYNAGRFDFIFQTMHIREEYLDRIDDYFNMYGYKTCKVKVPNVRSRPHWNYIQTQGCHIQGSIPADDADAICNIYDTGITFWKNGGEVGDYSLDNSPVS